MSIASTQRGAVLVIALLIVAIISALSVDFSARFQLSIGRAENRFFNGQLQQSLLSLEHAAMWALRSDKSEDNDKGRKNYDHFGEAWAQASDYKVLIEAEFDDVLINELSIEDAQGRFNINQLSERPGGLDLAKPFLERYTVAEKRFIRLLQTVPNDLVSADDAEAITQALIDWLDADDTVTGIGGAESDYYLGQDKPFKAANGLMVSVSELRLIKGVSEEIYEWIAPLVVALPDASGINVNTALTEVFRVLNAPDQPEPITQEDAETLNTGRPLSATDKAEDEASEAATAPEEGFHQVPDFLQGNELEVVFGTDPDLKPLADGLTTGSNYFILSAEVELDETKRRSYSLLKRSIDPKTNATLVSVVKRSTEDLF